MFLGLRPRASCSVVSWLSSSKSRTQISLCLTLKTCSSISLVLRVAFQAVWRQPRPQGPLRFQNGGPFWKRRWPWGDEVGSAGERLQQRGCFFMSKWLTPNFSYWNPWHLQVNRWRELKTVISWKAVKTYRRLSFPRRRNSKRLRRRQPLYGFFFLLLFFMLCLSICLVW